MPKTVAELLAQNGIEIETESLSHYGVVGMRWGKRKGGSPTAKAAAKDNTRRLSDVSDDELKTMITRIKLEREFLALTAPPPSKVAKGSKVAMSLLADVGKQQAKSYLNKEAARLIDELGKPKPKPGQLAIER